jgi:hypothetical protein
MLERALIVRKPWLDRIFNDGKIWEMRSTKTNIRGRIGLIESGSGLILGEVDLVDCGKSLSEEQAKATIDKHQVEDISLLKYWRFPWVLENAKRYESPIPYTHPSGAVIWVRI